jgi:D-xylose 1-dehydrogenase (NADP+, D-xylono-1,5-lactone-forming)
MSAVRWGMLSTAGIGRMVASAVRGSADTRFVAVASRDAAKARGFAAEFGLPLSFGSYQDLLACPEVDAVYVPLPVSMHSEWTVRALNAGKHVLCEKPFAVTAADAGRCFDAAEAASRLVIEGLMWREHPQTAVAVQLVAEGALGRLALVRAALSVSAPPGDIRRTSVLGGGAVLDLGCYCISAIRLFGGQPLQVRAVQVPDPAPGAQGCDLRLAATLTLPDDVVGQFDVGLDLTRRDELELIGTEGKVVVPDPWLCRTGRVELHSGAKAEYLAADPDGAFGLGRGEDDAYRIELDAASRAIAGGTPPRFGRADAVEQAVVIETVRRAAREGAAADVPEVTALAATSGQATASAGERDHQ